jgi:hypothetical protein
MKRWGSVTHAWLALGAALVGPMAAHARAVAAEPNCFDALVSATILRQTPTVLPDCGNDCIVMSWPWILDLDVERVLEGRAPSGPLTVLTVQHTDFRDDLGARRWWLRRNTLGGFNVLRFEAEAKPPRCPLETPPARPFITPPEGQTLQDLRREGERRYGRYPTDP